MKFPDEIQKMIAADGIVPIEIGESKSEVFRVTLQAGGFAYLKTSDAKYVLDEIRQEILVLGWLENKLHAPKPISFVEIDGRGYFLMSAIEGSPLSDQNEDPEFCLKSGARYLKTIHSLPATDCPFDRQLKISLALAKDNMEQGLVDAADFDAPRLGWTAKEVYADLLKNIPVAKEDLVFTHGDACFPNVIVHQGKIYGAVDWSRAGLADRHQDIALFLRSFSTNTGAEPNIEIFLKEYSLVDQLDEQKLEFYKELDEFF
jgi:aminoglycoside 3'-phosphotransferase-2